jgi:acetyl esterase/lipase
MLEAEDGDGGNPCTELSQLEPRLLPMYTSSVLGRIMRPAGLRPRPRSSNSYVPQGTACLEERLLLSGTVPSILHGTTTLLAHASQRLSGAPGRSVGTPTNQTVYGDITYTVAKGQPERLDVYVPKGIAPAGGWPVIVAIHGGGWRRFDKTEYGPRIASAFVPNGYVVVAPNYPLSSRGNPTWPLNLEDIQSAVRWVKINAGTFHIDAGRIAAMGESAGANLANLLGTLGTSSGSAGSSNSAASAAVDAVVSFSSPTDLAALYAASPGARRAVVQFLGGPPAAVPASYAAASPVDQVSPADPPTFLVHGGTDPLVPVSQSQELAAALRQAGVPNQLVVIPGAGHNLDFPIKTPRNLLFQILEFLDTTWNDKISQSLIH